MIRRIPYSSFQPPRIDVFAKAAACLLLFFAFAVFAAGINAQELPANVKSQEVSEDDGLPVLLKHLPEWEKIRDKAAFATDTAGLRSALGDRPVFEIVDFAGGTEAASAPYDHGKLLIIEYTNPQASVEADNNFRQFLAENPTNPPTAYRRIGNYSVFVFDPSSQEAAEELLGQVKYEKSVQWLGEDPFLLAKLERYFVHTTRDIFISTVLWIALGFGIAIGAGMLSGFIYFRFREQKRAQRAAFSDAGGLTRLNLDELSE